MYSRIWTCCYSYRVIYAKALNKVPIKAIKKETASLLASLFFFALEVGILRMPANEEVVRLAHIQEICYQNINSRYRP